MPGGAPAVFAGAVNARAQFIGVAVFGACLFAAFASPLLALARYAAGSELYSHILLIPAISVYLIWSDRKKLPTPGRPERRLAVLPFVLGAAILAGFWWFRHGGGEPAAEDYYAAHTAAFWLLLLGGAFLFVGKNLLRAVAFPLGFLVFSVPMPDFLLTFTEEFLQEFSADAASLMLGLSGIPVLRNDLSFALPGFSMLVAPECSGIHSTLVLFVTSFIAGYMFLRSPWVRVAFSLAVIPLALLRNGLRIFTLGHLCSEIDSKIIDSAFHHRGGPIFFAFSLLPFMLLLLCLRKYEKGSPTSTKS